MNRLDIEELKRAGGKFVPLRHHGRSTPGQCPRTGRRLRFA